MTILYRNLVCVCVFQQHVEELPGKKAAVEDLNSRHKRITFPDKQKDLRIINTRWAQVCSHQHATVL